MDFASFAKGQKLDLLVGALLIAKDAYPALNVAREIERIDALAAPLYESRVVALRVSEQASLLADYLFERCGFRGNQSDYYDPKNSFLNQVLDRKLGIPISLSVLYTEVARRVGVRARGVAFPGHFLVRLESGCGDSHLFIDPFFGGVVVEEEGLKALWRRASPAAGRLGPSVLEAASTRQVLTRMLVNLKGIYATRGDYTRLLLVIDRLVDLLPEAADELRDRGLLSAKLGAPLAAVDDLRRYVELAPNAGDVAEVRRIIDQIEQRGVGSPN